ncbi:hypothetical protein D9758_007525 [Tetrapyrgos nigripes]|uniref:Glycoside hydrolase family 71 protein n=1 Tax=Tetrapyrgos nigripes TaxID=182062 RepID=A0A8H5G3F7_9AGAR|nr:hypothetical protein D9758_007525 [Tetrapyrgos nigripes]
MVGNTFPYTIQDWLDDISLASKHNIDGFALNIGIDPWQPDRVADAYQAALQSGLDFKLFLSLDMSSLPCASPTDAQALRSLVLKFAGHPNQLSQFTQHDELRGKITFVPSFFMDPNSFNEFVNGDFNWNGAWPVELTTASQGSSDTSLSSALTDLLGLSGSTSAPDATNIIPYLSTFLGGFLGGSSDDTNSPNSNVASKQTTDAPTNTSENNSLSHILSSQQIHLIHGWGFASCQGVGIDGGFSI